MTWSLHGLVKGKVFIVDSRERTTRGTWKNQGRKRKKLTEHGQQGAVREARAEREEGGRDEDREDQENA